MHKHMHCVNPKCFEDTCRGECLEQNEEPSETVENCCNNNCGCHEEQEVVYCED